LCAAGNLSIRSKNCQKRIDVFVSKLLGVHSVTALYFGMHKLSSDPADVNFLGSLGGMKQSESISHLVEQLRLADILGRNGKRYSKSVRIIVLLHSELHSE